MPKCAWHMHGACTAHARGVPVNRTPYKPTTRISRLGSARRPAVPGTAGKHPGRIRGPDARAVRGDHE